MAEYNMQCPMAAKRLIYSGLPATVEHGKPKCAPASTVWAVQCQTARQYKAVARGNSTEAGCALGGSTYQANSAVAVAQTVSDFITVMDSLKLGMKAVDEVPYRVIQRVVLELTACCKSL